MSKRNVVSNKLSRGGKWGSVKHVKREMNTGDIENVNNDEDRSSVFKWLGIAIVVISIGLYVARHYM